MHSGICATVVYVAGAEGFGTSPLTTDIQVMDAEGKLLAKGRSNESGKYEIELPPGTYRVALPKYGISAKAVVTAQGGCAKLSLRVEAPAQSSPMPGA